ncbi:MAG: histidine phosphatase family protein [Solirubrobacteraceae bacterium]
MAESLLLVRHGETDDNLDPIHVQGFTDTPLNATGARQAVELSERAAELGIRSLWCSDLARALTTAQTIGARVGLEPRVDSRLRESDRGDWEGKLFLDVEREDPEGYAAWLRAGAKFRFPGGESLREQQERVGAALEEIRALAAPPALVVCHRGSIRVMLCSRDPRGLAAFHDYEIPNAVVFPW